MTNSVLSTGDLCQNSVYTYLIIGKRVNNESTYVTLEMDNAGSIFIFADRGVGRRGLEGLVFRLQKKRST